MFTQGRIRVVALGMADAACIASVWMLSVLSYWWLGGDYDPEPYLSFWPVVPAFLLLNAVLGLYNGSWMYPAAPLSPVEEMRRLFLSSLIVHLAVVAFLVMLFQTTRGYSRVVIASAGVLTSLLSQSFRNWMRYALFKLNAGQIPVLLAGAGEAGRRLAVILKTDPYTGFKIVGYFNGVREVNPELDSKEIPCLGSFKDIVPEAKRLDVKILIACQDERLFRCQMKEFSAWFTYIEFLPTASAFPVFGSKAVVFDGLGGLEMVNQARKRALRFQKWLLDKTLALIAFVVALPFFIVLPVLIKLTSRGTVFYRQERLGRYGKPFRVWKFRSMYADADARLKRLCEENPELAAEWERNYKLSNDPRVTPFGRFLRRTSLDELPQLINVLCGEMALIGPRPIVAGEVKYYGTSYETFASVRPGVTGLWQISGRSDTDYDRRVALDTYYVLNWSPWMDLWILLRTVLAVVLMRGAR